jgi:hypothetical protein
MSERRVTLLPYRRSVNHISVIFVVRNATKLPRKQKALKTRKTEARTCIDILVTNGVSSEIICLLLSTLVDYVCLKVAVQNKFNLSYSVSNSGYGIFELNWTYFIANIDKRIGHKFLKLTGSLKELYHDFHRKIKFTIREVKILPKSKGYDLVKIKRLQ